MLGRKVTLSDGTVLRRCKSKAEADKFAAFVNGLAGHTIAFAE